MPLADEASGCQCCNDVKLAALVEQDFPNLSLTDRRLDQSGGDHRLLKVANHLAFRFPRRGMHDLVRELALLRRLHRLSPMAAPNYRFVDPAGRLAGYPLIKGSELTPARFAALSPGQQHAVLTKVGSFLAVLHGLPADMIPPIERWPTISARAEYSSRGLTKHGPGIAARFPKQTHALEVS